VASEKSDSREWRKSIVFLAQLMHFRTAAKMNYTRKKCYAEETDLN
jgi:hypothetical protein